MELKKKINNVVVFFLSLMLLVMQCTCSVSAAEPQTISLMGKSQSVQVGDAFVVPVTIRSNDSSHITVGGLVFSIYYDSGVLTYVEGSEYADTAHVMKDALVYHNASKSKITFAWTSSDEVKVKSGEKIFYATFQALDTTLTETDIHLVVEEAYAYENGVNIYDLRVENSETIIDVAIKSDDSKVKNVEALIQEIGVVSYSKESLDKINIAAQAYSILTEAQKKQVSNFLILSEAMVEYERLRIEAEGMAVSSEISAYMSEHGYALALTTDTVTLKDEDIVNAAIRAFDEELSVEAQSQIYAERRELKNVFNQIEILKKEKAEQEEAKALEASLRKEAQEYAKAFRDDYATFLTLNVDALVEGHYDGLNAAIQQMNMLIGINPYVEEYLKGEKIIIQTLYDEVKELMKNKDDNGQEGKDAQISADSFRTNFAYVLSLTPETVTADDFVELRIAEAIYYELDAEVQNLLVKEFSTITELLEMIEELPGTESEVIVSTVQSGIDSLKINFANRAMGTVVWILLLLLLLSSSVFVVLQLFYHFYVKRNKSGEQGGVL